MRFCIRDQGTQVVKSNGDKCRTEKEALFRWVEHYESALNHPAAAPCSALDDLANQSVDNSSISVDAPTLDEVSRAILKLKNGRSLG